MTIKATQSRFVGNMYELSYYLLTDPRIRDRASSAKPRTSGEIYCQPLVFVIKGNIFDKVVFDVSYCWSAGI